MPTHPPAASQLSSEQSLALIKLESCRCANEGYILIAMPATFGFMRVGSIARQLIAHVFVLAEFFSLNLRRRLISWLRVSRFHSREPILRLF